MLSTHFRVVGRGLMRVLPVTQPRDPLVSDRAALGELMFRRFCLPFDPLSEPARDRSVVLGGQPECRERQAATALLGNLAPAFEGRKYLSVELGRGDDRHGVEVLRGGPQHRGSSDVYLLDGL